MTDGRARPSAPRPSSRAVLALRAETWCHMIGDRRSAEADEARSLLCAADAAADAA